MNALPALALFGSLGTPELIIILIIVMLLFGAAKLPQLGAAMGKTIKNFKQEMKDGMGDDKKPATPSVCPKCAAQITDPDSSFCPKCGQKL